MPPQPTPAPIPLQPRQAQPVSTVYVTGGGDAVVTVSVNPSVSQLPLDNDNPFTGVDGGAGPNQYGTVSFQGVGGTYIANKMTTTLLVTSTDPAPEPTDVVAPTSSSGSSIPIGAVVAAMVSVGIVCFGLIGFCWWRRRRAKRALAASRERRRKHSEMNKSFVGGHGYAKDTEGPWEEFKAGPDSSPYYVPGTLPPSPPTTRPSYSDKGSNHHLLTKISSSNLEAPKPRPYSVKSTVTGKVNPSNNFADGSFEDEYDLDDAKSSRSRYPQSPQPGQTTFASGPGSFPGLSALNSEGRGARSPGDPTSFLTFRSGDGDPEDSRQHSFPAAAPVDQQIRHSPIPQQTPKPTRALTQKSQKGNAPSQLVPTVPSRQPTSPATKGGALDSLLAALDTQEARRSVISHRSYDDRAYSPIEPHVVPSPSDPSADHNPFREPSHTR